MYTVSQKKQDTKLLPITSPDIKQIFILFSLKDSVGLGNLQRTHCLNIPPHLNCVATLPVKYECQKMALI